MNVVLTQANFLVYAAKHYDNPQCFDETEFHEDLKKFKYLKRLFNRYVETGELRERLILNHIIVITNLFGVKAGVNMLFLKMDGFESCLKPFLVYLNMLPDTLVNVGKEGVIHTSSIGMDNLIIEALRKI